jgi:predicted methyltransferase
LGHVYASGGEACHDPAVREKRGARLGIIDRTGSGTDHRVQKDVVIREAGQAGFRLLEEHDDLVKADKVDYFLVFVAK